MRNDRGPQTRTVIVSKVNTRGSCVRYLESLSAYSFHSWAGRLCEEAMVRLVRMKKPSKKRCKPPPVHFIVSYNRDDMNSLVRRAIRNGVKTARNRLRCLSSLILFYSLRAWS